MTLPIEERRRYADEMRKITFFGVTLSTVATIASIIIVPIIYGYIQRVQSSLMTELEHCRTDSGKMWHEYLITSEFMGVKNPMKRAKRHYLSSRHDSYIQPNPGSNNAYGNVHRVQHVQRPFNYADSESNDYWGGGGGAGSASGANDGAGFTSGGAPVAKPIMTEVPFSKGFRPNSATRIDNIVDYSGIEKCCACAMGEPGDHGPQGPPGEDGIDGIPGEDGSPGPNAQPGENASQQIWCFDCPEAPAGPPGPIGIKGPPGYPGEPGDDGLDGRIGKAGPPGQIGLPGKPGQSGDKGPKGPLGILKETLGPPGSQGPVGPIGERGAPGNPGSLGKPGRQGIAGYPGSPGHPGRPGKDGANGTPGEQGSSGTSDSCSHCPPPRLETGYHVKI